MLKLPGNSNQILQDEIDREIDYLYNLQPAHNVRIAVEGKILYDWCERLIEMGVLEKSSWQPPEVNRWHYDWTLPGWQYAKSRNDIPDVFKGKE